MNQFEVKVKYTKELPNATLKRVTENYLLAKCESFTDAEAIATHSILGEIRGETSIEAIKKVAYQEIMHGIDNEGDWYRCSTTYTSENADTGKDTVIKNVYLVQAVNIDKASEIMKTYMGGMMSNFEIPSIVKTTILGVVEDKVLRAVKNLRDVIKDMKGKGIEVSITTSTIFPPADSESELFKEKEEEQPS